MGNDDVWVRNSGRTPLCCAIRCVHRWSRGTGSTRYGSVPTAFFAPLVLAAPPFVPALPSPTGRRSMRVAIVWSVDGLSLRWIVAKCVSLIGALVYPCASIRRGASVHIICYMRAQAARRVAGRTSGETRPRRKIRTLCAVVRARSVQYFGYIRDKNATRANTRGIVKLTGNVARDMDWALKARRTLLCPELSLGGLRPPSRRTRVPESWSLGQTLGLIPRPEVLV
ncbi:unnamed protein product [Heterotrigona itama]|uniref:Uncharacterized protein n=1 Tax=Heterotrigona itama TaxID=395501 RepID=A0A6V7HBV4_9HYME|nr:unnamed protein product [Heterotrigona itama]